MTEELLLALLNSTPIVDGRSVDALGDDRGARAWLAEHAPDTPLADRALLRAGRDRLQAVVRGSSSPSALADLLDGVVSRPGFIGDDLRWAWEPAGERALLAEAVVTLDALGRTRPRRLRPCGNDECALFLFDRSKSNTARWCSMASCGNRLKARRHHERTRGGPPGDAPGA